MMIASLAFIQNTLDSTYTLANRFRKTYILPSALRGGRNMVLLHNGSWVDESCQVPTEYTVCSYDSEKHCLNGTGVMKRWKWISAVASNDMSDFFSSLRVSADLELSDVAALTLYASQTGKFPSGVLLYTLRNGEDGRVDLEEVFKKSN